MRRGDGYLVKWAYLNRKHGRRAWFELGKDGRALSFTTRAAAEAECRRLEKSSPVVACSVAEVESVFVATPISAFARSKAAR